jgi:hypothetical protein
MKIDAVSEQVQKVMDATAIELPDLQLMVDRAAIITHESGCNRRYRNWIMEVRGSVVFFLRKFEMTDYSQGARSIIEECEECWGEGCAHCGWIGQVKRLG